MIDNSKVDLGSIQIHKKVLADIAGLALKEIDGVSLASGSFWNQCAGIFTKNSCQGISVTMDKDNQITIAVQILVRYGLNIPEIAQRAQDAIRRTVEKTTDINLRDVNVNVHGIERGEP